VTLLVQGLWTLSPAYGTITFSTLTLPTLPLGPVDKFPMSLFPWGMWCVDVNRCDTTANPVTMSNCVLIVPTATMDYMSYW
jgi:hypothetical protein